jgi:hypothetical protein
VQAEVERRIAAGEIVSAAQVKKMKQQAAPTGEWTGGCPSRTPRLPVAPATLCPSRVDRFSLGHFIHHPRAPTMGEN